MGKRKSVVKENRTKESRTTEVDQIELFVRYGTEKKIERCYHKAKNPQPPHDQCLHIFTLEGETACSVGCFGKDETISNENGDEIQDLRPIRGLFLAFFAI